MQKITSFLIVNLLILLLLMFVSPAFSSELPKPTASSSDSELSATALLDLLVTKGMITTEDATALKQKALEAAKTKAKPPVPVYPTVAFKVRLEARFSSVDRDNGQPNWGSRDDQIGGDGFALRRARFHMAGNLSPDVSYTNVFSSDCGTANPTLLISSMEWKGWKDFNLSAGMLIVPFGWEIQSNDAIYLQTDLATVSLLIPADKDMGIRFDSKRPLLNKLNYQIMIGNGSGRNAANPNRSYLMAARLYTQASPDLSIALSGSLNPNTDTSSYQSRFLKGNLTGSTDPYGLLPAYAAKQVDENMWGTDFQWNRSHDTLRGEYMRMNVDRGNMGSPVNAKGYYLVYSRGLEYAGIPDKLEMVSGIQGFDPNTSIKDKYDLTSYVLGLNYHVGDSRRYGYTTGAMSCQNVVRLNYIWNEEARDSVANNKWVIQYQTWF